MTSRDKGVRMFCPLGDYKAAPVEALNFLDYEPEDSAMIMKLAATAENVVDIGANMGRYSINIAKTFPDSQVYAFEPIPKTFDYLKRNVQLNALKNVHTDPFGLSNEQKDLTFYFYLQVDFIKCDVEGAELFAFQGGLETLKRDKPIVFTEMLRKWAAKFNYHPNEIVNIFSSIGYRCFYVKGDHLNEISEITEVTAETNFFFLHDVQYRQEIKALIN